MQDESEVDTRQKIVVCEVPGEFVVADFMDRYSNYLEAAKSGESEAGSFAPGFVTVCGFFITLFGAIMVLFGPQTIQYSYATGPTFFQYLELYPGLITTAGLLITSFGASIDAQDNGFQTPEQFLSAHYELELPRSVNDQQALIVHVDGGAFKVLEHP